MLNHVTSAHGNSPDCSENSDSDSSEENELELEDEKESLMSRPLTISSAVSRCKTHGKMSELGSHDMILVKVMTLE
jgi:hypothetical protein